MVGYSEGIMAALDQLRPERSVLVVEEPQVIQRRQIEQRLATHPCSVDLVPTPIQGEKHPSRSVAAVPASLMWGSFFPGPSTAWWRPPRWLKPGGYQGPDWSLTGLFATRLGSAAYGRRSDRAAAAPAAARHHRDAGRALVVGLGRALRAQASQPTSQPRPPTTTDLPARSFSGLLDHLATLTRNTLRVGTDTAGEFDLVASPPRPSDRPSICSAQPSRCGSSSQQATPDRNENAWSAMVNPIHDHVTSG